MAWLLAASTLNDRVQIVAIAGSALLFFFVLELLRRRRLAEPYAILWLIASVVLLVFSVWDALLQEFSDLVGISTPANALFALGGGFILILLLSFSSVVSRLTRENKLLAQEIARLNRESADERGDGAPTTVPPGRQESPIPE
jgi:hypothetical protein